LLHDSEDSQAQWLVQWLVSSSSIFHFYNTPPLRHGIMLFLIEREEMQL
jgi:hypothetical protein